MYAIRSYYGLLNPGGAEKYFNSKETAVALGMYIADLGYVRHFERVQMCTDYLEAVRTLAGKLAIGEKEFNETVPLIESNLGDSRITSYNVCYTKLLRYKQRQENNS